jgi:hypothetical protein
LWWSGVFAGVFAKSGVQTWCFCVVNVVQSWTDVWLTRRQIPTEKEDRSSRFIFCGGSIALIGYVARVHAIRTSVGGDERHVSLGFSLGPSVEGSLVYALVILSLAATPYLLWRLQNTLFYST